MTLSSRELIQATGLSTRQLDYWTTNGVIATVGSTNPGSGYYRRFDESIVPKVILLVKIANILDRNCSLELLKRVYERYDDGRAEIADNVFITW
jgi:DNA-binding transcriptional MerR regulator